ncbi:MAG: MMPL family transporter, partial [Myxococcota bacterium]|nr:MMPL family transporter [Myxococcota bacterium]
LHLTLRTDGNALVPPDSPEVLSDAAIRKEFGIEDQIAVVVQTEHKDGIYNVHTLELVRKLSQRFAELQELRPSAIVSLATEKGSHTQPGTYNFLPYLEPPPRTSGRLSWLRKRLGELPLYAGTLISFDASATVILIDAPDGSSGVSRLALHGQLKTIVEELQVEGNKVVITGAPIAESLLGQHVMQSLLRLLPLVIVLMALILFLVGKSFWAVLLPLQEVLAALVFTFGLMGWFGVPVYLTTAILPVILTAVGVADEIHIFNCYRQILNQNSTNVRESLVQTMREMTPPIVKTSLTTALAFVSFAFSSVQPVQAFGLFMAIGVLFCLVWSLTVIPAALMLIPAERFYSGQQAQGTVSFRLLKALATLVMKRSRLVLILFMGFLLGASLGLPKLFIQDSWLDGFSPQSAFRQETQEVNQAFKGIHQLRFCWDAAPVEVSGSLVPTSIKAHSLLVSGDLVQEPRWLRHSLVHLDSSPGHGFRIRAARFEGENIRIETLEDDGPMVLDVPTQGTSSAIKFRIQPAANRLLEAKEIDRIKEFATFLQSHAYVGGVTSTWDYLAAANFIGTGHRAGMYTLADEKYKTPKRALSLIKSILGQERRNELMNKANHRALFTLHLKNANFLQTQELLRAVEAYSEKMITPHGVRLRLAGDVAVSQAMIPALVNTQVASLLFSLVCIWLLSLLLQKSLFFSVLVVLPSTLAIWLLYALMGLWGMPLGVATSMFGGISIGLGVDYAVHFLERYRQNLSRGLVLEQAIIEAMASRGMAIVCDALTIGLSFGVLLFSLVPANHALGKVAGLCVLICFLATVTVLPALIVFMDKIFPHRQKTS